MKVLLVASSGGHLAHLDWLRPWWSLHARAWVTFDTPDARGRLAGEAVWWAVHPTQRSPVAAARNLALAWRVLRAEAPDVVVTTGAGVAVPFVVAARARGIPTVFVEVWDRMDGPSLTGRLLAPVVDAFVAQWPEQVPAGASAHLLGPLR